MPGKMKINEFYCVSCRSRVAVSPTDIKKVMVKNSKRKGGVPALRANCPSCNQKLFKWTSA